MKFTLLTLLAAAALIGGNLVLIEIGRRIGLSRLKRDPDGLAKGIGPAEGAVFGLLGLLVAFTFSGAASRFEERRHQITSEANAIGTAYLRLDLLPIGAQSELKARFRSYVDARLETYRSPWDRAFTEARFAKSAELQGEIWSASVESCRQPEAPPSACMLLLPALNEMIDITTTRLMATRNHPPVLIFLMLGGLSLMGALLVGYGMSVNPVRSWLHKAVYAIVMGFALYVILDLEFPRLGWIRVDASDKVLVELRATMK